MMAKYKWALALAQVELMLNLLKLSFIGLSMFTGYFFHFIGLRVAVPLKMKP